MPMSKEPGRCGPQNNTQVILRANCVGGSVLREKKRSLLCALYFSWTFTALKLGASRSILSGRSSTMS